MTKRALIVIVRFLDGRYHGSGEWPPSPFRMFQALVAAAHLGREVLSEETDALRWLENLAPPIIAAPKARQSFTTTYYVPRNGSDVTGGDLMKAAKSRDPKFFRPWLFDQTTPFFYLWTFENDEKHPLIIAQIAERLYQLGRGIDMAFAVAEIIAIEQVEQKIFEHPGTVYRPTTQGSLTTLPCPNRNTSFMSLIKRHRAQLERLQNNEFRKAPPPTFVRCGYNCPTVKLLYDVVENTSAGGFATQSIGTIVQFTEKVRDCAAARLQRHYQKHLNEQVDRFIVGRNAVDGDKLLRIRIVPLPSVGFIHTSSGVRRLLVDVPPDCPIPLDDIRWAFSGLNLGIDYETGEVTDPDAPILVTADNRKMLEHYGVEASKEAFIWRTVTPAALPVKKQQGKISGNQRALNESVVIHAAYQSLRHAGFAGRAEIRRIQREPFETQGLRVNDFVQEQRFTKDQLYHLEIAFNEPISGPILIGNGRYLGLGLMRPLLDLNEDVVILSLSDRNRPAVAERMAFLDAVRRALMACARDCLGSPGRLFSGHEPDGASARSGQHDHVFLMVDDNDNDGRIDRLLIVAPWKADRNHRIFSEERAVFAQVATSLKTVRGGRLGIFEFDETLPILSDDHLLRTSTHWVSQTPYEPTRFPKSKQSVQEILVEDLSMECFRRGLPKPNVEITSYELGPRGGVKVYARLVFTVAVSGPLMLGRTSHEGGGIFRAETIDDGLQSIIFKL
jgi:CRISPR-associated protein Csb2